jgi:hypothetical protein
MGNRIRRHPFLWFYVLAVAIPSVLFIYLAMMETYAADLYGPGVGVYKHFFDTIASLLREHPLLGMHRDSVLVFLSAYAVVPLAAPFLFFPLAPTVSALIVAGLGRGRQAVRALLGSFAPWRGAIAPRDGLWVYALVLLTIAGLFALALLSEAVLNDGNRLDAMGRSWGFASLSAFVAGWGLALFTNQGALLEELGWRGYAWPVLVRIFRRPLTAAVLLGVAWALWHFPREIAPLIAGEQSFSQLVAWQALFIGACIGMTIVAVTFVNYTGGSVLPAIMIHGSLNFLYQGFETGRTGVRSDMTWEPTVLWIAVAIVVLLVAGPDLGWRRRMQIHGGDGRSDPSNLWTMASRDGGAEARA